VKTALICGISGQDGTYLARHLLARDYRVVGTSRDPGGAELIHQRRLGRDGRVELVGMIAEDQAQVRQVVSSSAPDEIYALAGQSSVGTSFSKPVETVSGFVLGTLNLLEAVREAATPIRLFHASSSECFGDLQGAPASEATPFKPHSPYGTAKASAHFLVSTYRESYDLFAVNGILFNHESPLRPPQFVTRKIVSAACRIRKGSDERLRLGRLDIVRDWGWAEEYVDAMWRMLQVDAPEDLIIATGRSYPLAEFVARSFDWWGLDWRDHVDFDPALVRPGEPMWSGAEPERAAELLGWKAGADMAAVVDLLCQDAEHTAGRADYAPN
jgi:GDPmannose 4,6-dehydratase